MIVLDTNVISEPMRPAPAPAVITWIAQLPEQDLALTAVTAAELQFGVARLPEGRRRTGLARAVAALLTEDFAGRVLAFDLTAATHYRGDREPAGGRRTPDLVRGCPDRGHLPELRCHALHPEQPGLQEVGLDLLDPWET